MKNIENYTIIYAENEDRLTTEVIQRIDLGWQPYGNMVLYGSEDDVGRSSREFYQPMVMYEPSSGSSGSSSSSGSSGERE